MTGERKVSQKKRESNDRWDSANLKRMSLVLRNDEWDRLKAHIDKTGEAANAFIRGAIIDKLDSLNE